MYQDKRAIKELRAKEGFFGCPEEVPGNQT
jgi:hypothetical protein